MIIELENLSLEAVFDPAGEDIRPESAFIDTIPNPVHGKEFDDLETVLGTYRRIVDNGYVCRDDVMQVEPLRAEYPALESLLARYPIGSFSNEPSLINYEVSNEGFARAAYEAVVRTLKQIIEYIVKVLKGMWRFIVNALKRTKVVDNFDDALKSLQAYILEVEAELVNGPKAELYKEESKRIKDVEYHNLVKRWNGLTHAIIFGGGDIQGYLDTVLGILNDNVPPFVDAVGVFMDEIEAARTESEVEAAIVKMELHSMADKGSDRLTVLATSLGYRPNNYRQNPRITQFQGKCLQIVGHLRTLSNDHQTVLPREAFMHTLLELQITPWAGSVESTTSSIDAKISKIQPRLDSFDAKKLQPGLERVYTYRLAPFMVAISSILQGIGSLEQALGMMVTARDNTVVGYAKAALRIVKGIDAFVRKYDNELTLREKLVRKRHKEAVAMDMKSF